MSKQIVALVVLAFMSSSLTPSLALAQSQGTSQEQAACKPDVLKHCKALAGPNSDTFAVLACLQQNRLKLSRACASVLASHGV
jgi:hypothetical protein